MEKIEQVAEVEALLAEALNVVSGSELVLQLSSAEAWSGRVANLVYSAQEELHQMRNKYLVPKAQGLTELDRTVMLDAAVADYEARYKYLDALQEAIRRRVMLGQSLLKTMRTEIESGL